MDILPRTSGIYQILCVPTGKVYIGSAVNLKQRWIDHRKTLRGNTHTNRHLQNAWNKHSESAFVFAVLEYVTDKDRLLEREQAWMDATGCYDSGIGFNISPTAGSNKDVPRTPEWTEAHRQSRSHTVDGYIDPDGNAVTIHNLWDFCKQNDLKHSAMYRLAHGQGRTKSHKGWTHRDNPYQGRAQTWVGFVSPDGIPIAPVYNLSEFCREHGLSPTHMARVYVGNRPHHRGWTCKRGDDGV
jgi:group I intron endonuclease